VAPLTVAAATIPLLTAIPAARAQNIAQSSAQPSVQASPDDIESLERRLRADEQRLRELERKQHDSRPAMSKDSGSVQWGSKGLAIASADGSNVLRLGALVQADGRYFTDSTTSSTSN